MNRLVPAISLFVLLLGFGCIPDPVQQPPRSAYTAKPIVLAICPHCGAKNNIGGASKDQLVQCGNCRKVFNPTPLPQEAQVELAQATEQPELQPATEQTTSQVETSETVGEETAPKPMQSTNQKVILGEWFDGRPGVGFNIVFYTRRERTYRIIKSPLTREESSPSEVLKESFYRPKDGGPTGDFYIIDDNGDLQMWDNDGLIYTAPRVK